MAPSKQSKRWSLGKIDLRSILRHTIYPLVAGGLVAAEAAYQAGVVDPAALAKAAAVAIIAGVGRLLVTLSSDNTTSVSG